MHQLFSVLLPLKGLIDWFIHVMWCRDLQTSKPLSELLRDLVSKKLRMYLKAERDALSLQPGLSRTELPARWWLPMQDSCFCWAESQRSLNKSLKKMKMCEKCVKRCLLQRFHSKNISGWFNLERQKVQFERIILEALWVSIFYLASYIFKLISHPRGNHCFPLFSVYNTNQLPEPWDLVVIANPITVFFKIFTVTMTHCN